MKTILICLTSIFIAFGAFVEADRWGKAAYQIGMVNAKANKTRADTDHFRFVQPPPPPQAGPVLPDKFNQL